jgi:hypothetical protein
MTVLAVVWMTIVAVVVVGREVVVLLHCRQLLKFVQALVVLIKSELVLVAV